jgi:pyruvate-ferredoxin/flavodoxin oxidoreductase
VIAFSPCIDWGFPDMKEAVEMMKEAVDCGYWSLYRYNPSKTKPLSLDSKKIRGDLFQYLAKQGRFEKLVRMNKDLAINLHD